MEAWDASAWNARVAHGLRPLLLALDAGKSVLVDIIRNTPVGTVLTEQASVERGPEGPSLRLMYGALTLHLIVIAPVRRHPTSPRVQFDTVSGNWIWDDARTDEELQSIKHLIDRVVEGGRRAASA